jgi:hypothetical protein
MFEIFALGIYSLQWLGIVLGVGAEVVLLVAHLIALHQHKPQWLESIPAVRTAQFVGIFLIVASGAAAVAYQFMIGQQALLMEPVFGFKWALIIALTVAYLLEKHVVRGHAALEGFTGATWLALFLVHSLAPIAPWLSLIFFYLAWLIVFGMGWGAFVVLMKFTGKSVFVMPAVQKVAVAPAPVVRPIVKPAPQPIVVAAPIVVPPKVVVAPPPPPPAPKPIIKPVIVQPVPVHIAPTPVVAAVAPKPVIKPVPAPVVVAKKEETVVIKPTLFPAVKKESFWHKLMALFAKKPKAVTAAPIVVAEALAAPKPIIKAAPAPAPVVVAAPVIKAIPQPPISKVFVPPPAPVAPKPAVVAASIPANLPVVEHLELEAPHAVSVPKVPQMPGYVPDYNHIPGLRIMPQRIEDLHLHNRAPIVQPA